jgi:FG-GAP-like repeat
MRARALNLAIAVSALAALGVVATIVPSPSRSRYTRFVAAPLPQHAVGDFDGDGRPDVANISARGADHQDISIALSGSADAIRLDAAVSALIEEDFDHDGDLDLLATTPSGDVLIWVNDGHGRFTRQEPSQRRAIAGESAIASTGDPSVTVVTADGWVLEAPVRAYRAVVARAIRPPTAARVVSRNRQLVPPLRAPPVTLL